MKILKALCLGMVLVSGFAMANKVEPITAKNILACAVPADADVDLPYTFMIEQGPAKFKVWVAENAASTVGIKLNIDSQQTYRCINCVDFAGHVLAGDVKYGFEAEIRSSGQKTTGVIIIGGSMATNIECKNIRR